jgi:fatty acid amide hydrolase
VNPQLHAVVVGLWEQARREACEADAARARGQVLGPLHGVPVTIKELLDVAGTATTAGLTSRARHRAQTDAAVVACVRRAGAIVLGKTNAPQLGMMVETDNPVYGRTNNPWDLAPGRAAPPGREPSSPPAAYAGDRRAARSIRISAHACGITD